MRRLDDDGDDDVAVLRPASSAPAEVDEDFERDFAQLMQDYQGARPVAGRQGQQFGGPAGAALPASEGGGGGENAMVFKVRLGGVLLGPIQP
jgi:hypothetical protein